MTVDTTLYFDEPALASQLFGPQDEHLALLAQRSGLVQALSVLKGVEGIRILHLTEDDVIRHPLVAWIIKAYANSKTNP